MIRPSDFIRVLALWALVLAGASASLAAEREEENPRLPLAMEVLLKTPKAHQYDVHIHLTNVSSEAVRVNAHDLPWVPPNDSKWFRVIRLDRQRSLIPQQAFLGEVGSQVIRLVPGESIQDKIVLNHRIPSLREDIAKFGVQIHWECPPEALKFVCQAGAPQTITIPKGDPGQPDTVLIDETVCHTLEKAIDLIDIPDGHEVLFLLATASVISNFHQTQSLLYQVDEYVRECQPMWTNSWSVSFFTERKYAGFLRDEEGQHLFEQGLWQQANIGQYSSQFRTLYRFPWIKKKANSVYLSVYH